MSEEVSEEIEESTSIEEAISDIENGEEISEEIESEEVAETEEEEAAPEPLYTITVNGEELELNMEQMRELAQKGKASAGKFQEAAKLRKEIAAEKEAMQAALRGSPEELLKLKIKSGHMTVDEARNWIIQQALAIAEEPDMSPEEIKMKEMQDKINKYEKEEEEKLARDEQIALDKEVEKYREDYTSKFMSAIESGGLDSDPMAVSSVARLMRESLDENGVPMVSVEDAVEYYKSEERSLFNDYLSNLDIDKLGKLIGEDKLGLLRQKDLEKIKNPEAKPVNPFSSEKPKSKVEKQSATEFFKNLGL